MPCMVGSRSSPKPRVRLGGCGTVLGFVLVERLPGGGCVGVVVEGWRRPSSTSSTSALWHLQGCKARLRRSPLCSTLSSPHDARVAQRVDGRVLLPTRRDE
eukprot:7382679-Prymnesium_polylepis.1